MNDYEQDLFNGPLPLACGDPPPRDLAWLAGFTDGEGTISLSVNRHRNGLRTITPRFSLSNTNLSNLGRARLLLARLTGHDVKVKTKKSDGQSRPAYAIELASHFDVDTTVRALYPYLVGKWPQAHAILEYLTIAPGHPAHPEGFARVRGKQPRPGARYDSRHWDLVTRVREMNRRYAPGEWQAAAQAALSAKPAEPPGHTPMDPLKRWYKLYVG
ncbi:MAG: hypothetical protein E6I44_10220 [Chloroflexi bacterium]|nr:MAG: hypothetical protein E6I44_10220 [Chloroflexota bacterium]